MNSWNSPLIIIEKVRGSMRVLLPAMLSLYSTMSKKSPACAPGWHVLPGRLPAHCPWRLLLTPGLLLIKCPHSLICIKSLFNEHCLIFFSALTASHSAKSKLYINKKSPSLAYPSFSWGCSHLFFQHLDNMWLCEPVTSARNSHSRLSLNVNTAPGSMWLLRAVQWQARMMKFCWVNIQVIQI